MNNVALDVAIGLIFVYLLYSLLATVIGEIIAVKLNLRARNLRLAVSRMLNDEGKENFLSRLWNSIKIFRTAEDDKTEAFYNHPEIKYLGSNGLAKTPSSFKAVSFSKTVMFFLNGTGPLDPQKIEASLRTKTQALFGEETADYVLSLWEDSYNDVVRFKLQLEQWFDRTMEQTTEWYKRKIQVVLIAIGFMLAWLFNADTFEIARKLSNDKVAREQMVNMATAYIESGRYTRDTARQGASAGYNAQLDSLLEIKQALEADIAQSHTILGSGGWPADSVALKLKQGKIVRTEPLTDLNILDAKPAEISAGYVKFDFKRKLAYFFALFKLHFAGFAVTAIAISLGAPFWFDLLNRLMQLRTSMKQPSTATNNSVPGNTTEPTR